jgi:hypothetical protein
VYAAFSYKCSRAAGVRDKLQVLFSDVLKEYIKLGFEAGEGRGGRTALSQEEDASGLWSLSETPKP